MKSAGLSSVSLLWGQWGADEEAMLCCCSAGPLWKTLQGLFIVVEFISKSLKYSYEQLLIWFLYPRSASVSWVPTPPHPTQAPGTEAFLLFLEHSSFLSVQRLCLKSPLLAHALPSYPLLQAHVHPSFRANWDGTPLPLKNSPRFLKKADLFPASQRGNITAYGEKFNGFLKVSARDRSKPQISW